MEDLAKRWGEQPGKHQVLSSAYPTHYFLNSIRALRQGGLRAEDVQPITCYLPGKYAEFYFPPPGKAYRPGAYDARFSLPYLLAEMLVEGYLDLGSFTDEKVRDPQVLKVAERVGYAVDEESWVPDNRGHLEVTTRDGRALDRKRPHSELPGKPETPA